MRCLFELLLLILMIVVRLREDKNFVFLDEGAGVLISVLSRWHLGLRLACFVCRSWVLELGLRLCLAARFGECFFLPLFTTFLQNLRNE